MTLEELKARLRSIPVAMEGDAEYMHMEADQLLLEFIADKEVSSLFADIEKWYS